MREKHKIQFMLHLLSGQSSETVKYGPILLNCWWYVCLEDGDV